MRKRKSRRRAQRTKFLIVLFATLIVLFITFISIKQYKQVTLRNEQLMVVNEQWPMIEKQLQSAISSFDRIATNRPITVEDVRKLENSTAALKEIQRKHPRVYLPNTDKYTQEIENRVELNLAELLWQQSVAAESEAEALLRKSGTNPELVAESIAKIQESIDLQNEINDRFPSNLLTNYPRSIKLKTWIQTVEAEPTYQKFAALKSRAQQHYDASEWESAVETYQKAIELQEEINNRFPNAPQADESESLRLLDSKKNAKAHILLVQSEKEYQQAEIYIQAEKEETAIERLTTALQLQNQINNNYPLSEVVSKTRADGIASKIQLLRAKEHILHIEKLNRELSLLQAVGMSENIEYKLNDLQNAFSYLDKEYPLYPNPPDMIREKTAFLKTHFEDITTILTNFNSLKKSTLSETGTKTLSVTELINQTIYEQLMDQNPSRNKGGKRPCDSVSYDDAKLFCKYLSFVLGFTVQLPTQDQASKQSTNSEPQEASLPGEWILPTAGLPTGKSIILTHKDGTIEPTERDVFYRSRNVGFRVVVESEE